MDDRSPQMLKPTLIAGTVTGVVAAIPFLGGVLLCACCSPVIGCGFLAAYLYSRACVEAGVGFRAGQGATVGLVSGAFFALANSVVGGIIQLLGPKPDFDEILSQMEQQGMEPEALDTIERVFGFLQDTNPLVLLALGFFFWLIVAAVLSTIGGLIGGAVFKKEPRPPAPATTLDAGTPPSAGV